jgi:SNF2 family DNA or RNA helicase
MTYEYKTEPFDHQRKDFELTRELTSWAQFHEQGTGKSKITIDTAAYMYEAGEINGMLIIAPNAVHQNWRTEELPAHLPDRVAESTMAISFLNAKKKTLWHKRELKELLAYKGGFKVLTMPYSGFMTKEGKELAWEMMKQGILMVCDESGEIKTPGAKRTRSMIAAGKYPAYKRILDGTPTAQSPFDVYAPLRFLDKDYWKQYRIPTFQAFKHRFGTFMGAPNGGEFCTGYVNLDELHEWLQPISSRVLKEDVLDLPPRLYSKARFEMTPEQTRIYDMIKDEYRAEINGMEWEADLAIVRQLRLQQVTCGYLPTPEEAGEFAEPYQLIGETNPRLELLMELLEHTPHQAIIWARFRMDIDQIMDRLGTTAVRLDGSVDEDGREEAKRKFKAGEAQWMVANAAVGGTGLTLNHAKSMFFYSNSFVPRHRLQAEDRNHRIGQDTSVLVTDLMASQSIDYHIVNSLRRKRAVSAETLGDRQSEWL